MSDGPIDRLTDRQKDCLGLVAQGYTSKEIGRRLGLSPSTVDNHINLAMQALDAPSRAAAAREFAGISTRQNLPSQSPGVAEPQNSANFGATAKAGGWAQLGRQALILPPLGGQPNDLDGFERTFRIIQIAVLSVATLTAAALVIGGLIKAFS